MTTIYFSILDSEEIDPLESPFDPNLSVKIPLFGKPKEIGHFSIDSERRIHFNRSQMKYLVFPLKMRNVHLDLKVNFDDDIFHEYVILSKLYRTLQWLQYHQQLLKTELSKASTKTSNVDFVTVRGSLVLIMCTPYLIGNFCNQWEICATKYNGIIYFSAINTDRDVPENKIQLICRGVISHGVINLNNMLLQITLMDFQICHQKHINLKNFVLFLKNVLNDHKLLYEAEIDAVIPHRQPTPGYGETSCYTELKTSKNCITEDQKYCFNRYKSIKWWAQSCLAGIPEIICGKRSNDGIVRSIDVFQVSDLPQEAKDFWSADVCLNFCDKFLNFLKKVVIEDDYKIVYKFSYRSGNMIYCSKLINPELRYTIIPEWYTESLDE
ncbi:decapping and exoribonuclease protein [Trichonephila clavipes]|nr:decapping and exoribonuclease protein [Trichonephila clavipes]